MVAGHEDNFERLAFVLASLVHLLEQGRIRLAHNMASSLQVYKFSQVVKTKHKERKLKLPVVR